MPKRDEALAAFGRNVAKFRNKRGFSQDELAEEPSLDRTYLSGVERGVRNPGIKVVIRLARLERELSTGNAERWKVSTKAKHDMLRADFLISKL